MRRLGRLDYVTGMELTRNEYNDLIVELHVKTSEEMDRETRSVRSVTTACIQNGRYSDLNGEVAEWNSKDLGSRNISYAYSVKWKTIRNGLWDVTNSLRLTFTILHSSSC